MEICVEIVSSVVGKIAECTVTPVVHQLGYFFNYRRNISNLKSLMKQLIQEKEKLHHLVTEATNRGEEIEQDVRDWLTKTGKLVEESKTFFEEEGQANTRCSGYGTFPNVVLRRWLSRKAEKMAEDAGIEIKNVQNILLNKVISYRGTLPSSTENHETFESRISTLTKVMDALRDPNVHKIGVYGMAGVGKTTLAKAVEQQALEERLFDVVVMLPISQTPNFEEIQKIIADTLGITFQETTLPVRAKRLQDQLRKQEKKILIILDDVWKKLELQDIGLISSRDDRKGFKMLLTSRFHRVCFQMDTDENFEVGILSEDEALMLFKRINGDTSKSQDAQDLVANIVKECAGLPLAITTIASALKGKGRSVWEDVLRELRNSSPADIDGMEEKVYSSIKMSYKNLDNDITKSLLVICSLHKEDAEIHIDHLLRYGLGFGLFQGITTLEEARNKVSNLVDILKSSSLLLEGRSPEYVKLHDVVRDVVISIAAKEKNMHLFKDAADLEVNAPKLGDSVAISLLNSNVDQLPKRSVCARLKLLFMFGSYISPQTLDKVVFEETSELRVLLLTSIHFERLQSCFRALDNLQTLCLNDWQLKDVASIGELKQLKVLDLAGSGIEELPREIGQLTSLKLLDLSYCRKLKIIKPNVISSLTKLEELNMRESFTSWEVDIADGERSNASLVELSNLVELSSLYIRVDDASVAPKDKWLGDKLKRYDIIIGFAYYWESAETSRRLAVNLDHSSQLDECKIQTLLKTSEELRLNGLAGLGDVVPGLDKDGFPHLKRLSFGINDQIRHIVNQREDMNHTSAFPKLEWLSLWELSNLEGIWQWHGNKNDATDGVELEAKIKFPQLRELYLRDLPKLKQFCPDDQFMKMTNSTTNITDSTNSIPLFNHKVEFPSLRRVDISKLSSVKKIFPSSIPTKQFPNLEELSIYNCDTVEEIFDEEMDTSSSNMPSNGNVNVNMNMRANQLSKLTLSTLPKLKHVWIKDPQIGITQPFVFQNLKEIEVSSCPNMETLFPPSLAKCLVQLQTLDIRNCELLREIVAKEVEQGTKAETTMPPPKFVFPKLNSLTLDVLPQLVSFYGGEAAAAERMEAAVKQPPCSFFTHKVEFPSLRRMHISRLSSVRKIFPSSILTKQFPNLEELSIYCCDMVEEIFDEEMDTSSSNMPNNGNMNVNVKASQLSILTLWSLPKLKHVWNKDPQIGITQPLVFQNLKEIVVLSCPNLETLLPPSLAKCFVQLQTLDIRRCELLGEIVAKEVEQGTKAETTMPPPKFVFPKLNSLTLQDLPQLVSFYGGEPAAAERMEAAVKQPPCSFFTHKVEFLRLRRMHIFRLSSMKKIFPSSIPTKQFPNLEELSIYNCDMMEEIFDEEMDTSSSNMPSNGNVNVNMNMRASQLSKLTLSTLPKLKHVWIKDPQIGITQPFVFQNLKEIEVSSCPNLETLFPPSLAKCLVQLQTLDIRNCELLREIVAKEVEQGTKAETTMPPPKFVFPKLNSLTLDVLPQLVSFYGGEAAAAERMEAAVKQPPCSFFTHKVEFPSLRRMHISRLSSVRKIFPSSILTKQFPNLEELSIYNCDTVEEIFDEEMDTSSSNMPSNGNVNVNMNMRASQLSKLTLSTLPKLKHVWNKDPQIGITQPLVFQNLKEIMVFDCPNLEMLFPPSLAKCLVQLHTLEIRNCELLREIVAKEVEQGTKAETTMPPPEFVFPKLNSLILKDLPQLVSFYSGLHSSEWPSVQSLEVSNCMKVAVLAMDVLSFKNKAIQQLLFFMEKVSFPNLEEFKLEGNDALSETQHVVVLERLRKLHLSEIPSLRALPLWMDNLEALCVWKCLSLNSLVVSSSVSLQNLTSLTVSECHGMVNLLTNWATAKSFGRVLRRMSISKCRGMTQIIAATTDDETEAKAEAKAGEFVFSKLETLVLYDLPSLSYFYSGNRVIKFPNLERVIVTECPDMQSFCIHGAITQKLDKIFTNTPYISYMFDRLLDIDDHLELIESFIGFEGEVWKGDMNTTMQHLWKIAHPQGEGCSNEDLKKDPKQKFEEVLEYDHEEDSNSNSEEVSKKDLEENSDSSSEGTSTEESDEDSKYSENDSEKNSDEDYIDSKNESEEDSNNDDEEDSENESEEESNNDNEEDFEKSSEKDFMELDSRTDFEEDSKGTSEEDYEESSCDENVEEDNQEDLEKDSKAYSGEKSKKDSSKDVEDGSSNFENLEEDS